MSVVTNARWVGAIQCARVAVQFASLAILSRLLTPQDFGLVALSMVVTNFAMLIRDLGTAAAIIQRPNLDARTIDTAFWSNCLVGLLLGLGIYLAAPRLASAFAAEALEPLLRVAALAFPVLGSTIVHQALLERSSRFALVARIEITAVLAGFTVAIVSAWLGAGAFALILQMLTVAAVSALQFWLTADWRPRLRWALAEVRGLWRFSGRLFGFNLLNYFARNADAMIVGRMLGAASLGPYSLAYRIMLFPLHNLTFVAQRALFPVMSRRQEELPRVADMYLRTLSVIAFFTAPLMAGLFVLREPFVRVVLGEQWLLVAQIIAWLAPVGFLQSIVSTAGSVFMALGRTDVLFRLGVVGTALQVTAFTLGVRWGVQGVAACYLAANLVMAIPSLLLAMRLLREPWWRLLLAIHRPVALALAMAGAVELARHVCVDLSMPQVLQLGVLSAAGGLLYLTLSHFGAAALQRDVLRLFLKRASP